MHFYILSQIWYQWIFHKLDSLSVSLSFNIRVGWRKSYTWDYERQVYIYISSNVPSMFFISRLVIAPPIFPPSFAIYYTRKPRKGATYIPAYNRANSRYSYRIFLQSDLFICFNLKFPNLSAWANENTKRSGITTRTLELIRKSNIKCQTLASQVPISVMKQQWIAHILKDSCQDTN